VFLLLAVFDKSAKSNMACASGLSLRKETSGLLPWLAIFETISASVVFIVVFINLCIKTKERERKKRPTFRSLLIGMTNTKRNVTCKFNLNQ
jgi:ABC-type transport system involved in cytochrome c biogenesis permease subunit